MERCVGVNMSNLEEVHKQIKIEEIDNKIKKLSEEHEKIWEEVGKLNMEKNVLIAKEVIESKVLTKTKWEIENYTSNKNLADDGFTLKAVSKEELYDLRTELKLWNHDDFELSKDVELITDDGDSLIRAYNLEAGINFIKLAGLEVDMTGSYEEISSLRKKADSIQEFIDKICNDIGDKK